MRKKISVTSEIIILIVAMGLLGITVGIFGIHQITQSNKRLKIVVNDAFLPFQDLQTISFKFENIIKHDIEKVSKHELSPSVALTTIEDEFTEIETILQQLNTSPVTTDEIFHYNLLKAQLSETKSTLQSWLSNYNNNPEENKTLLTEIFQTAEAANATLEGLMSNKVAKASQSIRDNENSLGKSKFYFSLILAAGLLISMLLASIILIGIKSSLARTVRLIKKIASGDLSTKIERRGGKDFGELHDNLKLLSEKFTHILELAQATANNISGTSEELSSNAQTISDGANQQAATVEEIAASMEEISSRLQENTNNSISTHKIATKVTQDIKVGSKNVNLTVEAINSIAGKISIIGDIAFQTNILALNAAVEAARAGEHGKGFGVVANEVGKLAERSKLAALEINKLSESGVELAMESKALLEKFVLEISKTTQLISQITNANMEQNTGINEMNTSIQMLNQITQQNAASSEEMATVSEEMASQAQTLKESIAYFKFQKESKENKYLKAH